jgi:hypothetical protein
MRVLTLAAFALAVLFSAGASAQEQRGMSSDREVRKAACQRDARLIYRTGNRTPDDLRTKMMAARKEHVQKCMAQAG